MAWDLNKVFFVGRLTRDPELKFTPSGAAVCNFDCAVGGKKNADGTESVSFIPVTTWGKSAEFCGQYLKKGARVAVDGRLDMQSWTDKDSGKKRTKIIVVADRIQSLDSKKAEGGQGTAHDHDPDSGPQPEYFDNDNTIPFDPTSPLAPTAEDIGF